MQGIWITFFLRLKTTGTPEGLMKSPYWDSDASVFSKFGSDDDEDRSGWEEEWGDESGWVGWRAVWDASTVSPLSNSPSDSVKKSWKKTWSFRFSVTSASSPPLLYYWKTYNQDKYIKTELQKDVYTTLITSQVLSCDKNIFMIWCTWGIHVFCLSLCSSPHVLQAVQNISSKCLPQMPFPMQTNDRLRELWRKRW